MDEREYVVRHHNLVKACVENKDTPPWTSAVVFDSPIDLGETHDEVMEGLKRLAKAHLYIRFNKPEQDVVHVVVDPGLVSL